MHTNCEMPPMATTSHSQRHFQKGSPQYPKWASYVPPRPDEHRRQVTLKKGLLLTLLGLVLFTFTMGSWFPTSWFVCIQFHLVHIAELTHLRRQVSKRKPGPMNSPLSRTSLLKNKLTPNQPSAVNSQVASTLSVLHTSKTQRLRSK